MRGEKTFRTIIKNEQPITKTPKGRNNTLVMRRNDCLIARYYYYASSKKKCYEDIVRLLVNEFFLSPSTIAIIVQLHTKQVQAIKHKDPSTYYLQVRWPHLKW